MPIDNRTLAARHFDVLGEISVRAHKPKSATSDRSPNASQAPSLNRRWSDRAGVSFGAGRGRSRDRRRRRGDRAGVSFVAKPLEPVTDEDFELTSLATKNVITRSAGGGHNRSLDPISDPGRVAEVVGIGLA
jgi:hypothetical protein